MALTSGKKTVAGSARGLVSLGVIATVACLQGGLGLIKSGFARPARVGQGGTDFAKINDVALDRVIGVFQSSETGGVADADVSIDALSGEWLFKNSAGVDAITVADIGRYCFVIDDETVARTSASGVRPRAGVVMAVDATGVMVATSPQVAAGAERVVRLYFAINETDTLAGTSAELVSPVKGVITRLTTIVQKAVTTGGDVTAAVDTTAVDGLACTIADAATKGSVVTDTPTAGHASTAVAAGQRIQVVPDAAFATAGAISGYVEIAY